VDAYLKEENFEKANKLNSKLQKTFSHTLFFDADNTFHFVNSEKKVVITGTYTLDKNKLKFTSPTFNAEGKLYTSSKEDEGVVFFPFEYEGDELYLRMYPYNKTEVEALGRNAAKGSRHSFYSQHNKKTYFIGNDAESLQYLGSDEFKFLDVVNGTHIYIYHIREYNGMRPAEATIAKIPLSSLQMANFRISKPNNSMVVNIPYSGQSEIEVHESEELKIKNETGGLTFSSNNKQTINAITDLIVKSVSAAQRNEFNTKVKASFTALRDKFAKEIAEENARQEVLNKQKREHLVSRMINNDRGYEIKLEVITPANAPCGAFMETYTFIKSGFKNLTFCVGSTIKIKGGEVLFIAEKSQDGKTYSIK
jgi:antitoxin component of MazEF toxin-antitoxin module